MEQQLLRLQDELTQQTYRPGKFRTHWIDSPKSRMISVAPYRDRVVHHAVMNLLEPILDRHFHPDSYACRKGKGTLAAANRLQTLMRRHRYTLQCDIQKFFPSLDHAVMKTIFRRLIKDKKMLWLMDLIVECSNEQPGGVQWFNGDDLFTPQERRKGLPIGNLTSQWFANWYLNGLDHFVTSRLGVGAYVRYCDDFILLNSDKAKLQDARNAVEDYLASVRLKLHPHKVFIRPVKPGLTFVGYQMWENHRFLKKTNIRTFRRRVQWMQTAYACGALEWEDVKCRLDSWMGYAKHADTRFLMKRLSRLWRFQRGRVDHASRCPRRQLEQQCNELRCDQPQQQHADESQQQHWIPVRPALSENNIFFALNCRIQGFCERGIESPDSIPVLWAVLPDSRMIAPGTNGSGRHIAENPICPFVNSRKVA
jgi:retron-type reverse transcriptase